MAEKRTILGETEDAPAGPQMAALRAVAAEPTPEIAFVSLDSQGVTLIYGRDEAAIEAAGAARRSSRYHRADRSPEGSAVAARHSVFRWCRASSNRRRAISATSRSWSTITRRPLPSPRGALAFGSARDGAVSHCDLILDLSGGAPLFSAPELRDGYLRANPDDPAAMLRAVLKARDLTGTFDKPRYITFTEELCAHSRSRIVGCHRCLDLCPAGAITPNGDHVLIDAENLRRLRPMRRRLSDRRCLLCAAAGRCADAEAARAARHLSRGGRQESGRAAA